MKIDVKTRNNKLQHDINTKSAKILALSSCKIDKYEQFTGEEILPSKQNSKVEQMKFTYTPLEKYFEIQRKII